MPLDYPVSKKRAVAKLIWFNPAETHFYKVQFYRDRKPEDRFSIDGKGFGMLRDAEGNEYFVYGNELGGGSYGEDADKRFIKTDQEYVITSCWRTPENYQPGNHDFFMGTKARVRSIQLKSGAKPSRARYERAIKRRTKINKKEATR